MNNNDFVPYEQAKELNQLGFYNECLGSYVYDGSLEKWVLITDFTRNEYHQNIIAPLYQQAFKWFRDNHDLHGEIYSYIEDGIKKYTYVVLTLKKKNLSKINPISNKYNTYEECEINLIKDLIGALKFKLYDILN